MELPTCRLWTQLRRAPLIVTMLDPKSGRTYRMFRCECGEKFWTANRGLSSPVKLLPSVM